ncbi:MAG: polysaccharide deacetylase family protein [Lachnospiraceae bacterium]|nr:polysaccharide deacetylase family protein [Lachnospiraceae bacterium]
MNKDSQSADDQEMSEGNISDSTSETVNTGISDDIAVTDDTDISDDKTTADNSDIPDDIATTSSDTKSPAPVTTKYVAVTVDDGPDGTGCGEYLRICLEQDIRLTFFVVGQNIESNSEQLEAMINAGCEIGNHSWSHSNLTTMSEDEIRSEISDTTDGICNVLPQAKVSFVRAPFFAYSDLVYDTVEYPLIDAALAESDSEQSDKTLETLLSATDGDIILLHCWNEGSITALEKAIPEMKENGFEFVTVSELFNIKGVEPHPGSVYRHISENLTGKYTPAREIFTGGELTSGDWSNWTDAAVLDINELKAMSEGQALWVEYDSVANPCLILQSWSGGEGWVQVTPSSDDGSTAIFTYEDLLSQFKADSFSRLNACMIRPLGADLTVTSVSVAESKK